LLDAVLEGSGVGGEKFRVTRGLRCTQRAPVRPRADSLNELEGARSVAEESAIAVREQSWTLYRGGGQPPRSVQILLDHESIDLGRGVVVKNADLFVRRKVVRRAEVQPEDVANGALVLLPVQAPQR
jgi:hypothetical protein